jgi:hypothetical protein
MEQLDVIPWLMRSTPEGMKLIIPTHDLAISRRFSIWKG